MSEFRPPKLEDSEEELRALSLDEAIARSHALLDRVTADIEAEGKTVKAVCVLYSGGNDSTVLAHLLHERADFAVHINTGIGIEETREFVRATCEAYGLPLIEETPPPGCTYDELVLRFGFPGPAGHQLMFTRLKERGLRKVRKRFVEKPRNERVIFVAGMRVFESSRRWKNTNEVDREGSIVWVSPIAHWTNEHMRQYRERFEVPTNEVSANIHMSGECLCGAFAKPGELDMIEFFYPKTAARIRDLEERAKEAGVHCVWGTRPPRKARAGEDQLDIYEEMERQAALLQDSEAGRLCSACTVPVPRTAEEAIAQLQQEVERSNGPATTPTTQEGSPIH